MHGQIASEPADCTDLSARGFSGRDIRAMYLAREPHIMDLAEIAALLGDKDRRLALALLHTLVAFAALNEARRGPAKTSATARVTASTAALRKRRPSDTEASDAGAVMAGLRRRSRCVPL